MSRARSSRRVALVLVLAWRDSGSAVTTPAASARAKQTLDSMVYETLGVCAAEVAPPL